MTNALFALVEKPVITPKRSNTSILIIPAGITENICPATLKTNNPATEKCNPV